MSYKTELQSNNVDLQGILDKVNALPEMEEAPELPTLSNPAAAAQILSGYEVLDQHGIKLTGIMEDNGAVSQALNAGGSYIIPAGYHNGSGKVTGNSLASQTSATAAAADIASGKTAWVNGAKITGTLDIFNAIPVTFTWSDYTFEQITLAHQTTNTLKTYNFSVTVSNGATMSQGDIILDPSRRLLMIYYPNYENWEIRNLHQYSDTYLFRGQVYSGAYYIPFT